MIPTQLRFGIQPAAAATVTSDALQTTVGQQIEALLADTAEPHVASQIRQALKDPQAIIEVRSGKQVQTATPNMPLRELLPPEDAPLEITVSRPHVGG